MNTELVALRDKLRAAERDFAQLQARQGEAHKAAVALTEELNDLGFDIHKDLQEQADTMLRDAEEVVDGIATRLDGVLEEIDGTAGSED